MKTTAFAIILLSKSLFFSASNDTYDKVIINPEFWNAEPVIYELEKNRLVVYKDKAGERMVLQSVTSGLDIQGQLSNMDIGTMDEYYNNVCGRDGGDDMVVEFSRNDTVVKRIRLYEAYQSEIEALILSINSVVKEELKIRYAFQSHKISMEDCGDLNQMK